MPWFLVPSPTGRVACLLQSGGVFWGLWACRSPLPQGSSILPALCPAAGREDVQLPDCVLGETERRRKDVPLSFPWPPVSPVPCPEPRHTPCSLWESSRLLLGLCALHRLRSWDLHPLFSGPALPPQGMWSSS